MASTAQLARAEASRERILEVAERLFRTLGYQKTTVADIARELGMSPANLYRFFASKSAINEAIAERTLTTLLAELTAAAAGPGTPEARLRRVVATKFECCLQLFFDERRMHDMVAAAIAEHWRVIERFLGAAQTLMTGIIADGIRQGVFGAADPVAAASHVFDAIVCWTHPALIETCITQRGRTVEDMRTELASMTDFLLRALRNSA